MNKWKKLGGLAGLGVAALVAVSCSESAGPGARDPGGPAFWVHPPPPPPTGIRLVFSVQPNDVEADLLANELLGCSGRSGTIITAEVTARNAQNQTVTSFTGLVTVEINNNAGFPLPGTLFGTTTVQAQAGVAQFTDLCIDQPSDANPSGEGYTLLATATGVQSVESAPFVVATPL